MKLWLFLLLALNPTALFAKVQGPRILTIGGTISEIVCALELCENIVATDSSSRFPQELQKLPQIGYQRAISVEGILAQRSDLVILTDEAGPPSALAQLEASGKKLLKVTGAPTIEGARQRIKDISQALAKAEAGEKILSDFDKGLGELANWRKNLPRYPKILFIYARGTKNLMIAGEHTAAASMIELAGGENAAKGFSEYKSLTPEAVVAAAPEIILLVQGGFDSLGGADGVWSLPGLSLTPAFALKNLFVLDDALLLGMGPRLPRGAGQLMEKLHPDRPWLRASPAASQGDKG